jgi:hypothetical protein
MKRLLLLYSLQKHRPCAALYTWFPISVLLQKTLAKPLPMLAQVDNDMVRCIAHVLKSEVWRVSWQQDGYFVRSCEGRAYKRIQITTGKKCRIMKPGDLSGCSIVPLRQIRSPERISFSQFERRWCSFLLKYSPNRRRTARSTQIQMQRIFYQLEMSFGGHSCFQERRGFFRVSRNTRLHCVLWWATVARQYAVLS